MLTKRNVLGGSTALAGCVMIPSIGWACEAGGYGNSLSLLGSVSLAVSPNLQENSERNRVTGTSGLSPVAQIALGAGSTAVGALVGGVLIYTGAVVVPAVLIGVGVGGVVYFGGVAVTNLAQSGPIFESSSIQDGGYQLR